MLEEGLAPHTVSRLNTAPNTQPNTNPHTLRACNFEQEDKVNRDLTFTKVISKDNFQDCAQVKPMWNANSLKAVSSPPWLKKIVLFFENFFRLVHPWIPGPLNTERSQIRMHTKALIGDTTLNAVQTRKSTLNNTRLATLLLVPTQPAAKQY